MLEGFCSFTTENCFKHEDVYSIFILDSDLQKKDL